MQFQHGTVVMNPDLSLAMTPFAVDGRQLQSDPCASNKATYTRYNQSETMAVRPSVPLTDEISKEEYKQLILWKQKWQVYIDPYTKMTRLDLFKFDGSPMNPMFLAYSPPVMLPTQTMNPTPTATAAGATGKAKRGLGGMEQEPLNKDSYIHEPEKLPLMHRIDLNLVWWTGIAMIVFGGTAYLL